MSAVQRLLEGPPLSLADVADLLERHTGAGTDEARCKEAVDVLRRVRRGYPTYYLRVALRVLDAQTTPCETVREVIRVLRKWRHYSGT